MINSKQQTTIGNGHWEDDNLNTSPTQAFEESKKEGLVYNIDQLHKLADDRLTGLYYVNDPSNDAATANLPNGKGGYFPQMHNKKWGFNELQRRLDDLCRFLNSNGCSASTGAINDDILMHSPLQKMLVRLDQMPLPLHSH